MKLNDFFEKIYVISLLNAYERRDNIDKLSKKYDFKFEYIDGKT